MLDWQSIQATLFSLVRGDIEAFAPQHQSEQFYGFFLDCNSYYGDVFPCLNTTALLRNRAETYKHDLQSIAGPAVMPVLYASKTVAEIEEELRWSPGDWGYLQINRWDECRREWDPVVKLVELARDEDDSFEERFMTMACRLLIQIEESGVLSLLTRTPSFATMCADHDEPLNDSRTRLDRIRKQATGKLTSGGS